MAEHFHIPEFNRLATSAQSREADQKTIQEFGIDGFTLMEIAASGAADVIKSRTGTGKSGLFVCGKGNNGGDAIATARYLHQNAGHKVSLCFLFGLDDLSPDTKKNLDLIRKLQKHHSGIEISDSQIQFSDHQYDYIVDGIFGTGLSGDIKGNAAEIIDQINRSELPVFSMDVPSGLNCDTGEVLGSAVHATATATFGTNKLGFYLNDAQSITGEIYHIPLPFPNHLKKSMATLLDEKLELPKIDRKAKHKYDGGVVHILAGSEGMTGAAIMAAKSTWNQGSGAVILHTPKKLLPVYEKNLPQIIKKAYGGDEDSYFTKAHAQKIISFIKEKPGVILIGPGIGTDQKTTDFVTEILSNCDARVIIDADGLAGFDRYKNISPKNRGNWILTPHIGEAKSCLNMHFTNDHERLMSALDFTAEYNCCLLLKGSPTFFINTEKELFITGYETDMFNRAGFGDVLCGTIAGNWGITNQITIAVLKALLTGYNKYQEFSQREVFGPEHLL